MMLPLSRSSWYPLCLLGLDVVVVAFTLWLAYFVRFHSGVIELGGGYDPGDYVRVWPLAVALVMICFSFMRLYDYGMKTFDLDIFQRISTGALMGGLFFFALDYFVRQASYSRVLTVMALVMCVAAVSLARHYLNQWHVSRRIAGLDQQGAAIVGIGRAAVALAQRIQANPQYGYRVMGFIEPELGTSDRPSAADEEATQPRLGHLRDIGTILRAHPVDAVLVASPHVSHDESVEIFQLCEREFVGCKIAPDLFELMIRDMQVENLEGIPLMTFKETPLQGWNFVVKRLFDILGGSALLLVMSPVLAAIAAMIKIESQGQVFYLQQRMGLDGRVFNMIKFRSMHVQAERDGPVWSVENDPRRTRVGRTIRALNFDELPQLINVIRGDMSLVGPRPERPHFIDDFKTRLPRYMARHRVRAGMTGWAQVHGLRGNTSIDDRLKYDLYYIENWSFWMDIKILLMTLRGSRRPVL